jgi:hypothetical protein
MACVNGYIASIDPTTSITVVRPQSGVTAIRGKTFNITWGSTAGLLINFNLSFYRSSSEFVTIATNVVGPTYIWTVPKDIYIGSFWYVRVQAADVDPLLVWYLLQPNPCYCSLFTPCYCSIEWSINIIVGYEEGV